ncbi:MULTISPECIES: type II toxin-antitoxin system Phd/YefM family antitoxin [unclassified Caballeronia]|uniref:type II toxin-antitoxin system Phd/YefM family antitoxin n=1 Tax=unclassified Caballeronia TaxID=2646786 RepID=UPI0020295ADD
MLLDRADQAISSTDLQKKTKALLDSIASGKQDRYVVIRDNRPAAVLVPTQTYESMMAELEDFRFAAIARDRFARLGYLTDDDADTVSPLPSQFGLTSGEPPHACS